MQLFYILENLFELSKKLIFRYRSMIYKRFLSDLENKILGSQIFNQDNIKNIKIYNVVFGKISRPGLV